MSSADDLDRLEKLSAQHDSLLKQLGEVNRRKASATKLHNDGEIPTHTWGDMHSEADIVIKGLKKQINQVSDEMGIDSIYK